MMVHIKKKCKGVCMIESYFFMCTLYTQTTVIVSKKFHYLFFQKHLFVKSNFSAMTLGTARGTAESYHWLFVGRHRREKTRVAAERLLGNE